MFPTIRHVKVRDPELQCLSCKGTGWFVKTEPRGFQGTATSEGPCQVCNGTGRNPETKTKSVELTQPQIEDVARALNQAKHSLSEDDEDRQTYQALHEKFTSLI